MNVCKFITLIVCFQALSLCGQENISKDAVSFSLKADSSLPLSIKSATMGECSISEENPHMQCTVPEDCNTLTVKLSNNNDYTIKMQLNTLKTVEVSMENSNLSIQMTTKNGHKINQVVQTKPTEPKE